MLTEDQPSRSYHEDIKHRVVMATERLGGRNHMPISGYHVRNLNLVLQVMGTREGVKQGSKWADLCD